MPPWVELPLMYRPANLHRELDQQAQVEQHGLEQGAATLLLGELVAEPMAIVLLEGPEQELTPAPLPQEMEAVPILVQPNLNLYQNLVTLRVRKK